MAAASKSVWFEGSNQITCDLAKVQSSIENPGMHFTGVVSLMPGITSVALVEQGKGFVVIKTNEGQMTRSNIVVDNTADELVLEFDEEYQAGKAVTTNAHFLHEFTKNAGGVEHRMVISGLSAPGVLGFFYKNFGKSSMGKAFLGSYKAYLEK
ncbi:MAG: hypothetical protein KKG00_17255 [Bacteroidetes bacterium]|nr:hypothetical protein [Bacteroidota bacterium]